MASFNRSVRVASLKNEVKVHGSAFMAEPQPEFPEIKMGPNQGPTPNVGKIRIKFVILVDLS